MNAKLLMAATGKRSLTEEDIPYDLPTLEITENPFAQLTDYSIAPPITTTDPLLGFEISTCSHLRRAFISSVPTYMRRSKRYPKGLAKTKLALLHGAYLVAINKKPVFSVASVHEALNELSDKSLVELTVAPERITDRDDRPTHLPLQLAQLRRLYALNHVPLTDEFDRAFTSAEYQTELANAANQGSDEYLLRTLKSANEKRAQPPRPRPMEGPALATPVSDPNLDADVVKPAEEEQALTSFTRRRLQRLRTWPQ